MSRYSECDLSMPPIFSLYRSFASFLTGVSKSLHRSENVTELSSFPKAATTLSSPSIVFTKCTLRKGTVNLLHASQVVFKLESSADQPDIISSSYSNTEQLWHCEHDVICMRTSQLVVASTKC
uniref:Uncharacterized protein n=1 Tax=Glossina austeni TaxID=7395 RepID=A0A1A9VDL6_GLOAU